MTNFETQNIIALAMVKEEQVKAFLAVGLKNYEDKISLLQALTTEYARNLADSFIEKHKDFFGERENRIAIYHHAATLCADKPHSGYRFWEELYKKVADLELTDEKENS